jgi:hypothetical protein
MRIYAEPPSRKVIARHYYIISVPHFQRFPAAILADCAAWLVKGQLNTFCFGNIKKMTQIAQIAIRMKKFVLHLQYSFKGHIIGCVDGSRGRTALWVWNRN